MTEELFQSAFRMSMENDDYKLNMKKITELGRRIMEHLGSNKSLFREYDIMTGLINGIYAENVYQLGLEAGLEAAREPESCQTKCQTKVI